MGESRSFTLHVFCSAKGGVGKSTLAVTCARLLPPGRVVVIDADLTGTSLADGLRLQAPRLPRPETDPEDKDRDNDLLDLEARFEGFHSVAETRSLRSQRWRSQEAAARHLPFLNDALAYKNPERECAIDQLLWVHEADDGVQYLPSSPTRLDVAQALGWLYREENPLSWLRRVTWLIDELLRRKPEISDIVLDLPPGLVGFSHEIMMLLSALSKGQPLPPEYPEWSQESVRLNPFLVTSRDDNDLFVALEHLVLLRHHIPMLVPLLNRNQESQSDIRRRVEERFRGEPEFQGIETSLQVVPELPRSLGKLFAGGGEPLVKGEQAQVRRALRLLEGSR